MNCLKPSLIPPYEDEPRTRRTNCIFCDVSKERGFDVVFENEEFVAFKDIRPAAVHHIQVIPKAHIGSLTDVMISHPTTERLTILKESVKALTKNDSELVTRMKDIGNRILDDFSIPASSRRMGFHIPPYNSVNHLHLHVQALPYKTLRWLKYPIVSGKNGNFKGFSWFVEVNQAIAILEAGRRVRTGSC